MPITLKTAHLFRTFVFLYVTNIYGTKVEIKSGNEKYGAIELNDKGFRKFEVERRSHLKPR